MMRPADIWVGFEKALDGHPFVTVNDLARELSEGWRPDEGGARLFVGEASALFARVSRPEGVLELGPVAGDLAEIVNNLLPDAEQWGKANGCSAVHIQAGREGWERVLEPRGYHVAAVILQRKL